MSIVIMAKNKNTISGGKWAVERLQLIRKEWFGGRCMHVDEYDKQCKVTHDIELAHAIDTDLSKEKTSARSSWERLVDVMNNPECFLLFCPKHHIEFDGRESIRWYTDYYEKGDREITKNDD